MLVLLDQGPDYVIGGVGTLFVTVVRRVPKLHMLEAIDRAEGAFVGRAKGPIRSLFVVREIEVTAPPDAAFRERSLALMERYGPHLVATAQVIEGDGFKTSIIRGFATGLTLLSRQKVPTRSFATVDTAVAWLAGLGTPDRALLQASPIVGEIAALQPG
jgi:hypothetical protein